MALSPKRRFLGFLLLAGRPWLAALSLLELFLLVEPTAVALVTGELVGRLAQGVATGAAGQGGVVAPLALLGALLVTGNVLRSMSRPLAERVGQRIDTAVREELTSRVLALPTLDRVEDVAVQNELNTMRSPLLTWTDEGIGAGAVGRYRAGLTMAGLVTAMLVLSSVVWWWGPATVAAALLLGRYRASMWREFFRVVSGTMPAAMRGRAWAAMLSDNRDAKEVRIFGLTGWLERHADENIADAARRVLESRVALLRREMSVFLGWAATASAVYVAVATSGDVSVGRIAATIGAVSAMFVISMSSQGEDMDEVAMPAVEAVTRIRALAPGLEPPPGPDGAGQIALRDVDFGYGEVHVLKGVTLTLTPGEVVAVVGVNGAGKTTLAKLLTGQYLPRGGTVVTEPTAYAVYQDFNRYELSAYENIRIAAPEATREQVEAAAAAVGATGLIERLPRGWETVLSPKYADGGDLSGGQWQKLALARAALAAREWQHATGGITLLVSHRFATIRMADLIVVLDGGRITECGTHAELIDLAGRYARLYDLQASAYQ